MRIAVVGIGAIGGFVAAELASAGVEVMGLHRPGRPPGEVAAQQVNGALVVAGAHFEPVDDPARLAEVDACLLTVKSNDTAAMAAMLATHLPPEAPVVSLQNGLHNVGWLATALPNRATGGVVGYNVFVDEHGVRHQATSGKLYVGRLPGIAGARLRVLRACFRRAGAEMELRDDIADVAAGKLLLNLNNGICAATGLGIAASLRDGDARWCFSRCIDEGRAVMKAAGLQPARAAALPAWAVSLVMRLPDAMVLRLARTLISVDDRARSSTLQDLDRGRRTEIGELNGAIVSLATEAGMAAPVNAEVTAVVRAHEAMVELGQAPAWVSPAALRRRIEEAS